MIKYIILAIVSSFSFCCYAQIDKTPIFDELKGKSIILPTYGDGKQELPFVYSRETFFTGQTNKKTELEGMKCLGVPITIIDTAVLNKDKHSAKYLILFAFENKEFTLCFPLAYSMEKKSKNLNLIRGLFYPSFPNTRYFVGGTHYYLEHDKIKVMCYETKIIQEIEELVKSKERIVMDDFDLNNMFIDKLFFAGTPNSQEADRLYVRLSNGIQNKIIEIEPTLVDDDRTTLRTSVTAYKLKRYFKK